MIESIYALVVDGIIIYIGRTRQELKVRLGKHISTSKTGTSKKDVTLRQLIEEGYEIEIILLEEVDTSTPSSAEDLHISNHLGKGLPLLNSKAGDSDRFIYVPTGDGATPWTPELFEGDWETGMIGAKATEKCKHIKGVAFFKQGADKLRFHHPVYGDHSCNGMSWGIAVNNAIAYFTDGTAQNKRMKKKS